MKLPIILQISDSVELKVKNKESKYFKNEAVNSFKIFKEPFFKPKIRI